MLVCLCTATNDKCIKQAIRCGARDEDDLAIACNGAGTVCGSCRPMLREMIDEHHGAAAADKGSAWLLPGALPAPA